MKRKILPIGLLSKNEMKVILFKLYAGGVMNSPKNTFGESTKVNAEPSVGTKKKSKKFTISLFNSI